MIGGEMKEIRAWIMVIGILVIMVGLSIAIVVVAVQTVHQVVNPIQQANESISTEIAGLLHPTPTVIPDPVTIIHDIRSLARLETIQYSVEKVITAQTRQDIFGPLFGDKLLFVAHGTVIAGVDLENLTALDLRLENGVLNVQLPPAEVFVATLDNDKSYVYDRQTGLLTHGDPNLETTARQAAEDEIRKAALEDGILNQAQQNAEVYLTGLLRNLGYPEVVYSTVSSTPTSDTFLP
jgi:Protein of unknown function (DUF4230)